MSKTKDKFSMSFGGELKLVYIELKTVQKGKTIEINYFSLKAY